MKKLIPVGALCLLLLLSLGTSRAGAQTLTQAEVDAFLPSLSSALTLLSERVVDFKARLNSDDAMLRQHAQTLSNISMRLGSTPSPSQAEIDDMSRSISSMSTQVSAIANWRMGLRAATTNIVNILGNIRIMLSTAV
jgi:hypothetical protein